MAWMALPGMKLPGSFYQIPLPLLTELLIHACGNYFDRGAQLVVLISGHNPPIQQQIMDQVRDHFAPLGKPVLTSMEFELADKPEYRISDHAGGYETAMMLALSPNQVNNRPMLDWSVRIWALPAPCRSPRRQANRGRRILKVRYAA